MSNALIKRISCKGTAHELLEKLGIEVSCDGTVCAVQSAFKMQKLISCLEESISLNSTFEQLMTTESIDYQHEAECAIALNSIVSQHANAELNKLSVPNEPVQSDNSNDLLVSLAKEKIKKNNKENINAIHGSSLATVTNIVEFKKRKSIH